MMYNETVGRIVDLMFDGVDMNDDAVALHDEVMDNCQERFNDMVQSGVQEDDAISAVIESLKGMEDVIAQYRRKERRAAREQAENTPEYDVPLDEEKIPVSGSRDLCFSPAEIHRIDLALISEDVYLVASDDGMYHVQWEVEGEETICVKADNGALKVTRTPAANGTSTKKATIDFEGENVKMDGDDFVGGLMATLGRALGRVFSGAKRAFAASPDVTICIPHGAIPHAKLLTTCGDVNVTNVALADLNIVSTSGDANVSLRERERLERIEARSTSGDIDVRAFADCAVLGSTSGDVEVEGAFTEVNANTISGNIDLNGDAEIVHFKTISGDANLCFEHEILREITGSTISGDIDVNLPTGVGRIAMNTSTRSGDVTTRYATNGVGPTVTGSLTTMSGDIIIR